MDGVAAGPAAERRVLRVTPGNGDIWLLNALRDGIRRVQPAPAVLVGVLVSRSCWRCRSGWSLRGMLQRQPRQQPRGRQRGRRRQLRLVAGVRAQATGRRRDVHAVASSASPRCSSTSTRCSTRARRRWSCGRRRRLPARLGVPRRRHPRSVRAQPADPGRRRSSRRAACTSSASSASPSWPALGYWLLFGVLHPWLFDAFYPWATRDVDRRAQRVRRARWRSTSCSARRCVAFNL